VGEATAHTLHAWGGRVGALIVIGAGLWIVRRRRPLNTEEAWTPIAVLLWIAADIAIGMNIAATETAKIWSVRAVVFFVLMSDYLALRSRHVIEMEEEVEVIEETILIEPGRERQRDKV